MKLFMETRKGEMSARLDGDESTRDRVQNMKLLKAFIEVQGDFVCMVEINSC